MEERQLFSVSGSSGLIKALAEDSGYPLHYSDVAESDFVGPLNPESMAKKIYAVSQKRDIHYELPLEYDEALEALKYYYEMIPETINFEVGKWYRRLLWGNTIFVARYIGNGFGEGLTNPTSKDERVEVSNEIHMANPQQATKDWWREATVDEVRETLLKMAELKGFVRGVEYISPWGTTSVVRNVDFARETKERGFRLTDNLGGGNYIYTDGIWGEVVNKNKLTLPNGREVEFKMDGVKVGCQPFHKSEIKSLYEAVYRWSGSRITGVSILGEDVPIDVIKSAYEHFYGKLPK